MDQLESQIAKIHLFSARAAQNYVFVMAEKATGSDSELYMVAELPLLNPAAKEQCEQICQAVAGTLKRAYRRPADANSFENAVAQINEELAKLAETGQTYWINKFNCVVAVKNGSSFTICTCGKTCSYLLRDGDFTDISTGGTESHPLKTFDSLASGKIKLGDLLILSNTQLLNYVAMDRLKEILRKQNFLTAAQTIIELLKENAGPSVGFGTILNFQVPLGQTAEQTVDLENYTIAGYGPGVMDRVKNFFKNLAGLGGLKRDAKTTLPKTSPLPEAAAAATSTKLGGLKRLTGAGGRWLKAAGSGWQDFSGKLKNAGQGLSTEKLKDFSPAKKYLFISIMIFVLAAGLSVGAAVYQKNVKQKRATAQKQLDSVASLLNLAQSALLYKDENQARDYFSQAQKNMPATGGLSGTQKSQHQKLENQINEFKDTLEHKTNAQVEILGNLAPADRLINLPEYLAVQSGNNFISYEKNTGKIEDGKLKADTSAKVVYSFKAGQAAVYNGEALQIWDYASGALGPKFISSVPAENNFTGLSYYPTNNRIYLVDRQKSHIVSFLINKNQFQKPVVSLTSPAAAQAVDITIDGNVYLLTSSGIAKFSAGKISDFAMPYLLQPLSGRGRLYTEGAWQYLYLLDAGNNRVLILDKKGDLVKILVSDKFTELKDFAVDESQHIIYLLNGSTLLKINF